MFAPSTVIEIGEACLFADDVYVCDFDHRTEDLETPIKDQGIIKSPVRIGDDVEIVLDGGIRRGSDVVKAVALGARAVMIGRAYLWGLATGGQAGVENVLDILRGGIDSALLGLGLSSIQELRPEDLVIPSGFRRDLGV